MSRLNDAELQAESLNRGVEEMYYGEWVDDDDQLRLQRNSTKGRDNDDEV